MEEFFFPVLIAIAVGGLSWGRWYGGLLMITPFASSGRLRKPLFLLPISCLAFLLIILMFLASPDVRGNVFYILAYLCIGAGWLGGTTLLFPFLGVSVRDDAIERRNPSALWASSGALIAVTLCFAGANIGSGPGPGVVFYCAALSTATFFLLWLTLELIAAPSEAITVDREESAGIRVAGFLIGAGILLGGAVAGNWESARETLVDFYLRGWPAILLLGVEVLLERTFSKQFQVTSQRHWKSFGIGFLYILASAGCIAARGWP